LPRRSNKVAPTLSSETPEADDNFFRVYSVKFRGDEDIKIDSMFRSKRIAILFYNHHTNKFHLFIEWIQMDNLHPGGYSRNEFKDNADKRKLACGLLEYLCGLKYKYEDNENENRYFTSRYGLTPFGVDWRTPFEFWFTFDGKMLNYIYTDPDDYSMKQAPFVTTNRKIKINPLNNNPFQLIQFNKWIFDIERIVYEDAEAKKDYQPIEGMSTSESTTFLSMIKIRNKAATLADRYGLA
jgi:hypothetical protein